MFKNTYIIINFLIIWLFKLFKFYIFKHKKCKYDLINSEKYYINLEHRYDRKNHIENEFSKLNLIFNRISGISDNNGALGCALSHNKIFEKVKSSYNLIFVCEDDIQFHCTYTELDTIIKEFSNDSRFDVLCLSYNTNIKFKVNNSFYITPKTQTMSCYIIKPYMIPKFINISKISIEALTKGKSESNYAIDQVWKKLQYHHIFAIPNFRFASQVSSYSDIKREIVNYKV